ncbi:MAG: hydrogenase maturation nickel metallochaperone HypA [Lentisphaeria bacterium]|nr:hydrogenase maturation nickel metallochaperone HypA [Lentisphaeria bacterium]
MHELSVAEALQQQLSAWIKEHGGRVRRVTVEVGRLCGVDAAALKSVWPVAAASGDPALSGCRLEVVSLPMRFVCPECDRQTEAEKLVWSCPYCGAEPLRRAGGRELMIKELELDDV